MTQTTVLKLALAGLVGLFCLSFAVDMRPTHAKAWGEGNYSGFLLHIDNKDPLSANHPVIAQINNETGDFRVCELIIQGAGLASSCSSWADGSGEYQLFPRKKFE